MKLFILILTTVILLGSSCGNDLKARQRKENIAGINKNTAGVNYLESDGRIPNITKMVKKNIFSVAIIGYPQDESFINTTKEITERKSAIFDVYVIKLQSQNKVMEHLYNIDYGKLPYVVVTGPSGNIIANINSNSKQSISDSALSVINYFNQLLAKNDETLNSFKVSEITQSDLIKTNRKNIFHVNAFNKIFNPDFVTKGKISILEFGTPKCHDCVKLKTFLLNSSIDSNKVDLYFVSLDNDKGWDSLKTSKAFKLMQLEGMFVYPTTWIVSPSGNVIKILSGFTLSVADEILSTVEMVSNNLEQAQQLAGKSFDITSFYDNSDVLASVSDVAVVENKTKPQNNNSKTKFEDPPIVHNDNDAKDEQNAIISIESITTDGMNAYCGYKSTKDKIFIVELNIEDKSGKTTEIILNKTSTINGGGNKSISLFSNNEVKKGKYFLHVTIRNNKNEKLCELSKTFKVTRKGIIVL